MSMLNEEQVQQYNVFGFVKLQNFFTADEQRTIRAEFDHRAAVASSDEPFDGTQKQSFDMLGDETPFMTALFYSDRFVNTAEQLVGPVIGFTVDASRRVTDTVWHYDGGGNEAGGVLFANYLQPLCADTGALRFIAGSHLQPWHGRLDTLEAIGSQWSREAATPQEVKRAFDAIDDVPAYACETEPGDVIAFDYRTFHASLGGSQDRHMCTFNYYTEPNTPAEIELTILQAKGYMKALGNVDDPSPCATGDCGDNFRDHPRCQQWLDRIKYFAGLPEQQRGVKATAVNGKLEVVPIEDA